MKRFYSEVTVAPLDEQQANSAWQILLDGKPIRNHDGDAIVAPNYVLASAIGDEWRAVEGTIDLYGMWLTRLTGGATSISDQDRTRLIDDMIGYIDTDLLCYFSDDKDLNLQQQQLWEPVLAWAEKRFDVVLARTFGLMPVQQPHATSELIRIVLQRLDAYRLIAASRLVGLFGSIWLFIASYEGHIPYEQAIACAMLDDDYQIAKWGADTEAIRAQKAKKHEMRELAKYLELIGK